MHGVPAQTFHQTVRRQPTLGLLTQIPRQGAATVQQVTSGFYGRITGRRQGCIQYLAGTVLRHDRIDPTRLRQSGGQRAIKTVQRRTLNLRPSLQPLLQPGQRGHRALGFAPDHLRVARQAVQHLTAGQPLQR